MSAIDFNAKVERVSKKEGLWLKAEIFIYYWQVENPKGDRVRITLDGKFLPYAKW